MKKKPRPTARHTTFLPARTRRKSSPTSVPKPATLPEKPSATTPSAEKSGRPVLVFLARSREKTLVMTALTHAGIRAEFLEQLDHVAAEIGDQTGAVLLAEEAFAGDAASQLMTRLRAQPKWSDLPLLVVASGSEVP